MDERRNEQPDDPRRGEARTLREGLAGPGMMLISAAVFGYFGFLRGAFISTSAITGKLLVYVPMLEWTLKGSAVLFALAAIVTFGNAILGNVIYGVVGLIGAVLFIVVGVMDVMDKQHTVMEPFILFLFAAWNGYGSWLGLGAVRAMRQPSQIG